MDRSIDRYTEPPGGGGSWKKSKNQKVLYRYVYGHETTKSARVLLKKNRYLLLSRTLRPIN